MSRRKRPVIYEIPTWAWLGEQSARYHDKITLGNVPAREWDALAALYVDAVWFMGVWQRSPQGIAVSNANADLQAEFARALPDYTLSDNVGSAYSVGAYEVDAHLGGSQGLAHARRELAARGIQLILDYVPNHVGLEHVWLREHPEYFIRGTAQDLERAPNEFAAPFGNVIANGRDPHFAPWRDVAQLNVFHAGLRAAAIETVNAIAAQCDGMRCDVAMLLLTDVFARTWGERAGARPETEFWQELIPAVKANHPDVSFIAEGYWNLEYELMQNGFDYCYDKLLLDRLERDSAESVHRHLLAGVEHQDRLVRFIENHDEPRAAATFLPLKERAAALIVLTLPGAKLVHDGQLEGRKIKLPVFLARRAPERKDYELDLFYRSVLKMLDADLFHQGTWQLCDRTGWRDNSSVHNVLAWTWEYGEERALIVVNYSAQRSQAMIQLTWDDLRGRVWRLVDRLNGDMFLRDGDQLGTTGLFVDLDAWRFHLLKFES